MVVDQNNNHQSKSEFSDYGAYVVKAVGRIPGPKKPNGQHTFIVVLGLFDSEGNQAVHTTMDGTEIPIVVMSYPIDTDIIH